MTHRRALQVPLSALIAVALLAGLALVEGRDRRTSQTDAPKPTTAAGQTCPRATPTPEAPVSATRPSIAPESAPPSATAKTNQVSKTTKDRALDAYRKVPLAFTPNAGQIDEPIRSYAQAAGFGLYFTANEAVLSFTKGTRKQAIHLVPLDASPTSTVEARRPGTGTVNYFIGATHYTNLPTYQEVVYTDLWPGIDMVFRGDGPKVKYEFRVAPGADPSRIRLAYEGMGGLSLGATGDLEIDTQLGTLRDSRPETYQLVDGNRVAIESRYALDERMSTFGFALGSYDRHNALLIDPGPDYSTYLGGSSNDFGTHIAVDDAGNAYVTGQTVSADFPTSPGALDTSHGGVADAFVAKLDASGSNLVYATYLGGSAAEAGLSIAVDGAGSAYVSGGTASPDFPTTPGAFDTSPNGNEDAFVAKLDPSGSTLIYSTFLGGSQIAGDFGAAIAIDDAGNAYVAGGTGSPDFPTTSGAFDTSHNGKPNQLDAFVAKLSPTGTALVFSTFLGGTCNDAATGIAVDDAGDIHVSGSTTSPDFPTTNGAFDRRYGNGEDAFVVKLNATGSKLIYSTYLGGKGFDKAQGIAIDKGGHAYVTGWTTSRDFPTTRDALDRRFRGGEDGFVAKLSADGSALAYSTYLGGSSKDRGNGIAVDAAGSAYVTGSTGSADFPTTRGAFARRYNGAEDAFVAKLNTKGSALAYSTYVGGTALDSGRSIAVDSRRNAYVTGRTESADYPTTTNAFAAHSSGGRDAFVTKLSPSGG
jgi:hypothetical protein